MFSPPPGRGGRQSIPRPPGTVLGERPVWEGRKHGELSVASVREIVGSVEPFRPAAVAVDGRPPSAVLVPMYDGPNGAEIIFTRRAWHLRSHTGEVSFPGGRMDPEDDDLVETALRETEEEIGLHRGHVSIFGELDYLTTVSSPSFIVPYLAQVDELPTLTPSCAEVDEILHISLAELFDPSIYREELWHRNGSVLPVTFFELVGDTLWGATARMVRNLLEILVGEVPSGRDYGLT